MHGRIAYQDHATQTASPAQLVLMLYDGVLSRIDRATEALDEPRDLTAAHEQITKAQRIVEELSVTLDRDAGGEVAANLASIYAFVTQQLVDANVHKHPGPLAEVTRLITPLRDAWETACVNAPTAIAVAG